MQKGFTNLEIAVVASVIAAIIFGSQKLAAVAHSYFEIIYRTLGS